MKNEDKLIQLNVELAKKSSSNPGGDPIKTWEEVNEICKEMAELMGLPEGIEIGNGFNPKKLEKELEEIQKELLTESDFEKQNVLRKRYIDIRLVLQGKKPVWCRDLDISNT